MRSRFSLFKLFLFSSCIFLLSSCLFEPKQRGYGEGVSGWSGDPSFAVGSAFVTNTGYATCGAKDSEKYEGIKFISLDEVYLLKETDCESIARKLSSKEISNLAFSAQDKTVQFAGTSYLLQEPSFEGTASSHEFFFKPGITELSPHIIGDHVIFFRARTNARTKLVYDTQEKTLKQMAEYPLMKDIGFSAVASSPTHLFVFGGLKYGRGKAIIGHTVPLSQPGGALYDPRTDTWEALPTEGMPEKRSNGRAVWTGKEFIVFGGSFQSVDEDLNFIMRYPSDAAAFNPTTRSWRSVSMEGAPQAFKHAVFWTGTELMALFHYYGGELELRFYNPETDTWRRNKKRILYTTEDRYDKNVSRRFVQVGEEILIWDNNAYSPNVFYNPKTETVRTVSKKDSPTKIHDVFWNGAQLISPSTGRRGDVAQIKIYSYVTDSWQALVHNGLAIATTYGAAVNGDTVYTLVSRGQKSDQYFVDELKIERRFTAPVRSHYRQN